MAEHRAVATKRQFCLPEQVIVTATVRFCRVLRATYRQVSHQPVDGVGDGLAG